MRMQMGVADADGVSVIRRSKEKWNVDKEAHVDNLTSCIGVWVIDADDQDITKMVIYENK